MNSIQNIYTNNIDIFTSQIMVVLSFKLSDNIVTSLRALAKQKKVSQTAIIEMSLSAWIEKEKQIAIENSFKKYVSEMNQNPEFLAEEEFLVNSASNKMK